MARDNADVCMTTALFTQNGEKQNKKIVENFNFFCFCFLYNYTFCLWRVR